MEHKQSPLLLERAASWFYCALREYKVPILSAAIVGLLAYGFTFTNKLPNYDDVTCLFSKGATIDSGRWGLSLIDAIFPNFSMPWIYGLITLALITAAVCLMVHLFSIRSKLLQGLLAGAVVVFPSLIGTFCYMFTSSSYGLAFLLAVLAAWLISQEKRWYAIPAIICMVASLSIYQAYISVCSSLLVLVLIHRLLREDTSKQIAPVIWQGLWFVAFLVASLLLYAVGTWAVMRLTGIQFNEYASNSISFSLSDIPRRVFLAYYSFLLYFTTNYCGLLPTSLSRFLHWAGLIATIILLVLWLSRQKRSALLRCALLVMMIFLLPLAICCMYLFTDDASVHTLVQYSFVAVYALAVIVADSCPIENGKIRVFGSRIVLNIVTLAIAMTIVCNIYLANEVYLHLYMCYENNYAFYTALVADLQMMPQFNEHATLAIIGAEDSDKKFDYQFAFLDCITGADGVSPSDYSKHNFLQYYIGFPVSFATEEECNEIAASPEYAQMPAYPYYGSMRWFGDTLVVKLS